ncbi:hypothetical protein, partial [Caballeronia sp. dw_19]|uniref:hypothetical protein n=1 Tax=Caballeronia sp. dw_19 TaxID=2719791 RepID=UPI001BD3BB15
RPTTEFVRTWNHVANPAGNEVAKMRGAVTRENSCTERAANSQKTEAVNTNTHQAMAYKYGRTDHVAKLSKNRSRKYP